MDIFHNLICPHGQGFWHLAIDLWWLIATAIQTPFYWIKFKINKFKIDLINSASSDAVLFERAYLEDISILSDCRVSLIKNEQGETPLHYLAMKIEFENLEKLLHFPDIDKMTNLRGDTPLHILASRFLIGSKYIKYKYPWYPIEREGIVTKAYLDKILSSPKSLRFILED